MATSGRLTDDLERLAETPDGHLTLDLLSGKAAHSATGPLELGIVGVLRAWLGDQMESANPPKPVLSLAEIVISYRKDALPTDRRHIVLFDLQSVSRLES